MHWTVEYTLAVIETSGYSIREIERRAGIAENTITRWKTDKRTPHLDVLDRVLKVLGRRISIGEYNATIREPNKCTA